MQRNPVRDFLLVEKECGAGKKHAGGMQPENRMGAGKKGFCGKNFPVRVKKKSAESECGYRKIYRKNERSFAGILTISTVIQAKNRTVF